MLFLLSWARYCDQCQHPEGKQQRCQLATALCPGADERAEQSADEELVDAGIEAAAVLAREEVHSH
jgi:hypothetical protein